MTPTIPLVHTLVRYTPGSDRGRYSHVLCVHAATMAAIHSIDVERRVGKGLRRGKTTPAELHGSAVKEDSLEIHDG